MSRDRRSARILAMQALCQWEVQGDESEESLAEFFITVEATPEAIPSAKDLLRRFWAQREDVDQRIAQALEKWDLRRMTPVDRNVLRVAVVEMLGGDVPPRVALDEAIEIAKEYGGADSPRFVNGVLDAVYRRILAETGKES